MMSSPIQRNSGNPNVRHVSVPGPVLVTLLERHRLPADVGRPLNLPFTAANHSMAICRYDECRQAAALVGGELELPTLSGCSDWLQCGDQTGSIADMPSQCASKREGCRTPTHREVRERSSIFDLRVIELHSDPCERLATRMNVDVGRHTRRPRSNRVGPRSTGGSNRPGSGARLHARRLHPTVRPHIHRRLGISRAAPSVARGHPRVPLLWRRASPAAAGSRSAGAARHPCSPRSPRAPTRLGRWRGAGTRR